MARGCCFPGCDRVRHARVRGLLVLMAAVRKAADRLFECDNEADSDHWGGVEADLGGMLWAMAKARDSLLSDAGVCCDPAYGPRENGRRDV